MGLRKRPCSWVRYPWCAESLLVRGTVDGLPALGWGSANPRVLATRRQLRAQGLRPGGDPVAVLEFGHQRPNRRRLEHANLYLIAQALPKRIPTPAQEAAIGKALAARRTCRKCGQVQGHYLSTVSRLCVPCEEATDFWRDRATDHGWGWAA